MSHSGRYVFQVDASSLVAPYSVDADIAPELRSVHMLSQVQVPLTDKTHAWVAGARLPTTLPQCYRRWMGCVKPSLQAIGGLCFGHGF